MDASSGVAEQRGGLAHVVQPPHALLTLDRDARRVDLSLERVGALELLPGPELHGRQAQRQPLGRDRQADVHQQPADGVHAEAALLVLAAVDAAGLADPLGPPSPVGELGRVVEHHDRAADAGGPVAGRAEVAAEDLALADPVVGEETVGRLGGGPILAGERDALPHRARHLGEQRAQPSAQPLVGEPASRDLVVDPGIRVARHRHLPEPPRCQRIRDRPRSAGYGPLPNSRHEQRMWVIESPTGRIRIFRRRTGFATLDRLLARLHANKEELLVVLERPEVSLNTNGSERDLRPQVVRRKISGGTRSDAGRACRDAFLGLLLTCAKLGLSFWDYLGDRLGVPGAEAPYLPDLVRLRSAPA